MENHGKMIREHSKELELKSISLRRKKMVRQEGNRENGNRVLMRKGYTRKLRKKQFKTERKKQINE